MNLLEFKDNLTFPLKKTIEQHRSVSLAQFNSRDDLTKQWDRAEGLQIALNHIENVYGSSMENKAPQEPNVEIIPPQ